MNVVLAVVVLAVMQAMPTATVGRPEPDESPRAATEHGAPAPLQGLAQRVLERFQGAAGWDQNHPYLVAALEQMYTQNGWTSESDEFSLGLAREVSAIPPWQMTARLDALSARLADRYLLDDAQERALRERLARESMAIASAHAARLMPVMLEVVQTRLSGEPFTAEQVARWTREAGPVFDEVRNRLNADAGEFLATLAPQQQERALLDLAAANRRLDRVRQLGQAWQQGGWTPADWGLQEDPVQRSAHGADGFTPGKPPGAEVDRGGGSWIAEKGAASPHGDNPAGPAGGTARPRPNRRPADDSDPWAVYVRDFIRRYKLDVAQEQRAWIIYDSGRERRDLQQRRFDERISRARQPVAASENEQNRAAAAKLEEAASTAREQVFEEMKRRLDRLPTRAQRRDAAPLAPAEDSASRPATAELNGP